MNSDDVPNDSSDRMSPDAFKIEGKEVQHEVDELDNNSDRSPDQILYKYNQVLASHVTKPFEQSTFGKMSCLQKILSTYFPKNLLPNLAVGVFSAKNEAKTAEN